jgi:hypothetical protein
MATYGAQDFTASRRSEASATGLARHDRPLTMREQSPIAQVRPPIRGDTSRLNMKCCNEIRLVNW